MKNKSLKKGFTLPEVLVSISILIMVVYSATSLLISAIRINADSVNTIVAYGLAQEGIEAFRNIRDSNWLLGLDYKKGGVISSGSKLIKLWGEKLPVDKAGPVYYLLDYRNINEAPFYVKGGYDIDETNSPWKLTEIKPGGLQGDEESLLSAGSTLLYKSAENGRDMIYTTEKSSNAVSTAFHRILKVELMDHKDLTSKKYRVSCLVAWPENNAMRKVVLTTELTDWKEGII